MDDAGFTILARVFRGISMDTYIKPRLARISQERLARRLFPTLQKRRNPWFYPRVSSYAQEGTRTPTSVTSLAPQFCTPVSHKSLQIMSLCRLSPCAQPGQKWSIVDRGGRSWTRSGQMVCRSSSTRASSNPSDSRPRALGIAYVAIAMRSSISARAASTVRRPWRRGCEARRSCPGLLLEPCLPALPSVLASLTSSAVSLARVPAWVQA